MASAKVNKNNKTLLMKFGGTSVGSQQALAQAISIVSEAQDQWDCVIVVVSAIAGVTNKLLKAVKLAKSGDTTLVNDLASEIRQAHLELINKFVTKPERQDQVIHKIEEIVEELGDLCQAVSILRQDSPRTIDSIVSLGERMSIQLVSAALSEKGMDAKPVEATQLIVTNDDYQNADPDMVETEERTQAVLAPIIESGAVPVITGFIGATRAGVTTTLGRGGSDYSAAILAKALKVDEVIIWTDVNGIMTSNPHLVKEARTIPELSYREAAELSHFGAKVLHPKAIRPIIEANIPLWVRNTFNPQHQGTRVVEKRAPATKKVIKAVTAIQNQRLVTVEGSGMLGIPGIAARTFSAVASVNASIIMISQASSEQSICFSIAAEDTLRVISKLEETFTNELDSRDIDSIWATNEVVIVTIVGNGIRNTPGVAGKIFTAVGNSDVNIIAIAQGSSEVSISLVVDQDDILPALHALHKLIGDKSKK